MYLTEQRLDNVISKIGGSPEVGTLMRLLVQDAVQDFEKDTMIEMSPEEKKLLKKGLMASARKLVLSRQ